MNKYTIFNDQNNFLHILVRVVLLHGHYTKSYRLKYNWIFIKILWRLHIFGSITRPIQ